MARVQNTLIGRASGSVGEVVFLTWRTINVTRSKPESVSNPRTILQQQQRNRFGATVELYRILKDVLAVGLKNRNRKMTLFNFFQRLNQQNCFDNVGDGAVAFLPENMVISYGNDSPIVISGITAFPGASSFIWSASSANTTSINENDIVSVVFFNETSGLWLTALQTGTRKTTNHIFFLGSGNNLVLNDHIHLWVFSYSLDFKRVSNTGYKSTIVV